MNEMDDDVLEIAAPVHTENDTSGAANSDDVVMSAETEVTPNDTNSLQENPNQGDSRAVPAPTKEPDNTRGNNNDDDVTMGTSADIESEKPSESKTEHEENSNIDSLLGQLCSLWSTSCGAPAAAAGGGTSLGTKMKVANAKLRELLPPLERVSTPEPQGSPQSNADVAATKPNALEMANIPDSEENGKIEGKSTSNVLPRLENRDISPQVSSSGSHTAMISSDGKPREPQVNVIAQSQEVHSLSTIPPNGKSVLQRNSSPGASQEEGDSTETRIAAQRTPNEQSQTSSEQSHNGFNQDENLSSSVHGEARADSSSMRFGASPSAPQNTSEQIPPRDSNPDVVAPGRLQASASKASVQITSGKSLLDPSTDGTKNMRHSSSHGDTCADSSSVLPGALDIVSQNMGDQIAPRTSNVDIVVSRSPKASVANESRQIVRGKNAVNADGSKNISAPQASLSDDETPTESSTMRQVATKSAVRVGSGLTHATLTPAGGDGSGTSVSAAVSQTALTSKRSDNTTHTPVKSAPALPMAKPKQTNTVASASAGTQKRMHVAQSVPVGATYCQISAGADSMEQIPECTSSEAMPKASNCASELIGSEAAESKELAGATSGRRAGNLAGMCH